jgi:arylsulfatase A-like enzyme
MNRRPGTLARVAEIVLAAPAWGIAWVLISTAVAFRGDDDKVLGVRASPIVELAKRHFAADVRALTASIVAMAIATGAAIGLVAEATLWLRRRQRSGPRTFVGRSLARIALVVGLHGALFAWGVARMPQLYTDVLWSRPGALAPVARTAQVIVTDVLGAAGVVVVTALALLAFVAPRRLRLDVRWLSAGLGLLGLVSVGLLLGARRRLPSKRAGAPNVVILAVDSLRDDRVSPRVAPHLAAVGNVRFSRAYVTLPRTLPSWTTILTGREPHSHGLRTMFPRYEDRARDLHALPARLAALGYRSGVVGDYAADIFTRVRYGFDLVDAPTFNFHALIATRAMERATPLLPVLHSSFGRRVLPAMRELNQAADPRLVAEDAVRALDRLDDGRPFLLTVFFSTAHFPYAAPAPYYGRFTDPSYRGRFRYHKPNVLGQDGALDAADVQQVRALYDGAVASVDAAAARILEELEARGLEDDTIVIVTADHGEMLYDDGHGQGHGDHLFGDQVVHVPLSMRVPGKLGVAPGRVDALVRDVDLSPTILDLVGAPAAARADLDGRSLRPLLTGASLAPRPVYAETEVWMTESIPELPSAGPNPLRLPYPNVSQLTELDPRLGHDVVMRAEAEPIVIAAKHRMVLEGSLKLVYVPTRKGPRWLLFDRASDPAETVDLSAVRKDDVTRLRGELWKWILGDKRVEERDGLIVPRTEGVVQGEGASAALRVQ